MNELEFWDDINGIGKLDMEMELVVTDEPILFVCHLTGNPEKKYLVMTYNSCKGKYVIREIDNQELLLMLENEVTMEQTFRNGKEIFVTYLKDDILYAEKYASSTFTGDMLPKTGAYYNIHSAYILEYIKTLKAKKYYIGLTVTQNSSLEYAIGDVNMNTLLEEYENNQNNYTYTLDNYKCQPENQSATMESCNNIGEIAFIAA